MSDIDRIIENVNATMEMENMPLTDDNKSMLRSWLEGRVLFEDMLNNLIVKYTREKVMWCQRKVLISKGKKWLYIYEWS